MVSICSCDKWEQIKNKICVSYKSQVKRGNVKRYTLYVFKLCVLGSVTQRQERLLVHALNGNSVAYGAGRKAVVPKLVDETEDTLCRDRFLEPFMECASVSVMSENRDYT